MADLFDNPMGLAGFEFVEFTAPEKGIIEPVFEAIGIINAAVPAEHTRAFLQKILQALVTTLQKLTV